MVSAHEDNLLVIEDDAHAEFIRAERLPRTRPDDPPRYRVLKPPVATTVCRFLDIVTVAPRQGHLIVAGVDVTQPRGWNSYLFENAQPEHPAYIAMVRFLDRIGAITTMKARARIGAIALQPGTEAQAQPVIAQAIAHRAITLARGMRLP